jgi:hypothetical protein
LSTQKNKKSIMKITYALAFAAICCGVAIAVTDDELALDAIKYRKWPVIDRLITRNAVLLPETEEAVVFEVVAQDKLPIFVRFIAERGLDLGTGIGDMLVIAAAHYGSTRTLGLLLNSTLVDPGAGDNEALLAGVRLDSPDVVEMLLSSPAVDPSARSNTIVMHAFVMKYHEVYMMLIKHPRMIPDELLFLQAIINGRMMDLEIFLAKPVLDLQIGGPQTAIVETAWSYGQREMLRMIEKDGRLPIPIEFYSQLLTGSPLQE